MDSARSLQPPGESRNVEPVRDHGETPAAAAAAGSPALDFDAIYEEHIDYVWRTLRRLGIAEKDLEDLCHEVFIAFFKRQDAFDPSRPLKPWLFGIAFNIASDHRRTGPRRFEVSGEVEDRHDESPDAEARVMAGQDKQLVHAALQVLDLDRRAVFVLHELEGQPIPAVAEALGVPLNTCYSRLRMARQQFTDEVRRLAAGQRIA